MDIIPEDSETGESEHGQTFRGHFLDCVRWRSPLPTEILGGGEAAMFQCDHVVDLVFQQREVF
jgi:hypothetical protein